MKEETVLIKTKPPKQVPRKEHHARLSYLYQISTIMAARGNKDTETLSRVYARNMDIVSKKAVLKLSPNVKRSLCKRCNRRLVPGITSTTRIANDSKDKAPRNNVLELKCVCGEAKRFPYGKSPDYVPFHERKPTV